MSRQKITAKRALEILQVFPLDCFETMTLTIKNQAVVNATVANILAESDCADSSAIKKKFWSKCCL